MKRLLIILSAVLLATSCRTARRTISDGPTSVSVTDEKGNQTFTNFAGRQSAGGGQAVDTGGTEVSKIIAGSVQAGGQPSAFLTISRSAIDQPDVDVKIENEHKAASENLSGLLKAGIKGNALGAAMEAVKLTNAALTERARVKAATPKPDTSGVTATAFLVGPDAVLGATEMSKVFGHALETQSRATFGALVNSTDISTTNEFASIENIMVKRAELELLKLQIELEKARKPAPVEKPAETPSEKSDASAAKPDPTSSNQFLWKPISDNGKKLVVILPAALGKADSVTVNGESGSFSAFGNGNRAHYRFGKQGGSYSAPASVVATFANREPVKWSIANPGKRTEVRWTGPANDEPQTKPDATNAVQKVQSVNGLLTVPADMNAKLLRAQVIHTRNGDHPAFDVSGVKGVGEANGFQWINYGKNELGIYNAGKPLSQYPIGKRGPAVWLLSFGKDNAFQFASNKDGDLVVADNG